MTVSSLFAPAQRSLRASLAALVAIAGIAAISSAACSSTEATAGCEDGKCSAGNKCLPLDGKVECRRTCSSNMDPATSCPFGYTCVSQSPEPFCVKDNLALTKQPKQWGSQCNPSGGFDKNPDCDSAQGFVCYGTSPADGAAYCTQYGCTTDRDCGAGYYCGKINNSPNVLSTKRSLGAAETTSVCLKREYCAPCAADFDCLPLNGITQRCVAGSDGVTFCAPECQKTENCGNDARCLDTGGGVKTCYPRATRCVGDGTVCSPCRSDADCGENGACVKGQYTTEKSCAVKSKIPCKEGGGAPGVAFDCPAPSGSIGDSQIACRGDVFSEVPKDYCHGLYQFGESADVGCYTPGKAP